MSDPLSIRVAARYKSKKKVKTEGGKTNTVYVYSERQIALRNRKKAERLEKLKKNIGSLRKKVQKDINSDDPSTALTALAVALMDHTVERVGNDGSADEGHFGVTGWQKGHLSFGRNKATIKYVGKSGVKHSKDVTDAKILKALRNAYEAAEGDDAGIFEHDSGKVTAKHVNEYLKEFDVTAKDIRGFQANSIMQRNLKAVRAKGKPLPDDKKKREKQLKTEFLRALDQTAEEVGHESSTLRSQYLTPGTEEEFLRDGTVTSKMLKEASDDLAHRVLQRFLCT
jgi:DNA topoisomerase-1